MFLCSRALLRIQPFNIPFNIPTTISKCIEILELFLLLKDGCNEEMILHFMIVRAEQLRPKWMPDIAGITNTLREIRLQVVRKYYSTFLKPPFGVLKTRVGS